MSVRLEREINKLKNKLLSLCTLVEESVYNAVKAFQVRDSLLARKVIEGDVEIDALEVELEEDCLKILALYQPVASDLRFIVAVLKINNDLERIGDLASNIAKRGIVLSRSSSSEFPYDLQGMAERTKGMLRKSIDALVTRDVNLAHQVLAADDEIDSMHKNIYKRVTQELAAQSERTESLILLLSVSRSLERIADLATNIAEDSIYMIEGVIIRHQATQQT